MALALGLWHPLYISQRRVLSIITLVNIMAVTECVRTVVRVDGNTRIKMKSPVFNIIALTLILTIMTSSVALYTLYNPINTSGTTQETTTDSSDTNVTVIEDELEAIGSATLTVSMSGYRDGYYATLSWNVADPANECSNDVFVINDMGNFSTWYPHPDAFPVSMLTQVMYNNTFVATLVTLAYDCEGGSLKMIWESELSSGGGSCTIGADQMSYLIANETYTCP